MSDRSKKENTKDRYSKAFYTKALVIITVIAVLAFVGWRFYSSRQGSEKAEAVMSSLESIIPGLGVDTGVSSGNGRDPLAAVSIEGMDIVGVLEVPSLNINAPVVMPDGYSAEDSDSNGANDSETDGQADPYFAALISGSPVQENMMLLGNRSDLFRKLSGLEPGDNVTFTDIDGVRYRYRVTTQYHLKKWDNGDNALMLCSESDSDTWFVVGCSPE